MDDNEKNCKKKLPWFRFHATDWLTSPTILLMNRVQKSMFVDLLCFIHTSGNCRLCIDRDNAMKMLSIADSEAQDFDFVWQQLDQCPEDPNCVTHEKMWAWWKSDQETHLKRKRAGRKGGIAKAKQSSSNATELAKQTLYESISISDSLSNSNKRFKQPTMEECIEHFEANGSDHYEAEKFFFFYDAKDWHVGKNKMKKWRSAASSWIKRNEKPDRHSNAIAKPTFQQMKEQRTKQILENAFNKEGKNDD